eukprot:TRINITY_DN1297_c0_g2_i3.p2 TRINITY_DN1297_c0_g2~~TRINITY_DN1297_c0_g2_i3.p2  ORF type:complete len:208 (+),score=-6.25 TRINITY_DN1297_c0_g2_i3:721-1344(+)
MGYVVKMYALQVYESYVNFMPKFVSVENCSGVFNDVSTYGMYVLIQDCMQDLYARICLSNVSIVGLSAYQHFCCKRQIHYFLLLCWSFCQIFKKVILPKFLLLFGEVKINVFQAEQWGVYKSFIIIMCELNLHLAYVLICRSCFMFGSSQLFCGKRNHVYIQCQQMASVFLKKINRVNLQVVYLQIFLCTCFFLFAFYAVEQLYLDV